MAWVNHGIYISKKAEKPNDDSKIQHCPLLVYLIMKIIVVLSFLFHLYL